MTMIRKRLLIALSMTVLLLMGCSKETVPSEPESTENDETVDAVTEVPDETENMEIAEVEDGRTEIYHHRFQRSNGNSCRGGLGYSVKVEYFIRRG